MSSFRSVALVWVLVLGLLALGTPVEAQIGSDCSKLKIDGAPGTFDLSALAKYPTPFTASDLFGQYTWRVCSNNVPCIPGKASAACQQQSDGTTSLVGLWDPNRMKASYDGSLVFVTAPIQTPGQSGLRAVRIHIFCDPSATIPGNFSAVGQPAGSTNVYYDFYMSHVSACPRTGAPGVPPVPPPGSAVLSGLLYPYDPLEPCSGTPLNVTWTLLPDECIQPPGPEFIGYQLKLTSCNWGYATVDWYMGSEHHPCQNQLFESIYEEGQCEKDVNDAYSFKFQKCKIL